MKAMFVEIPGAAKWTDIQPIHKGWSNDTKFYIKNNSGNQFLLRISDAKSLENEKRCYDALRKLNDKDILVAKLLDSGICNQGKNTFRLFSWIDGTEVEPLLANLSPKEQYAYGLEAGRILQQIHQINCPANRIDWGKYYNNKIDRKINQYKNCGIAFKNSDKILAYIEEHRMLIANRPQSFHHGDFHIGNMLFTPSNKLAVIDFNRLDFGDPWEEFNRITWSANKSAWFASGQINGYFEHSVPTIFFKLMALYIGVNQLGSIPWAIAYGEKEINVLINQTEQVLKWYHNFSQYIPTWYHKGID